MQVRQQCPARSNGIETYQVNPWSRWAGGLALADADAASNAYRNESRDQSDEYFFHWNSPFFHATRCTLRASLHRWSPAEANGSPAPETVGHFQGDCVLGDTVTRRAQQNLPESGSRSAPRHPPLPVYVRAEFEDRRLRQAKLRPADCTRQYGSLRQGKSIGG